MELLCYSWPMNFKLKKKFGLLKGLWFKQCCNSDITNCGSAQFKLTSSKASFHFMCFSPSSSSILKFISDLTHHDHQHQLEISKEENLIDNRDGFFSRSFVFPTCSENVWGSEDLPSLWYKLLTTSPDIVCEYLKRYHLWISSKIGRSVSRGFNFILTVVLLKTLQDKLKLYHWNFERMMDESSITASKRLISKEEVIFLVNEAFRFMTVYERKRRKVFLNVRILPYGPFRRHHLTFDIWWVSLFSIFAKGLQTLSPIVHRSIVRSTHWIICKAINTSSFALHANYGIYSLRFVWTFAQNLVLTVAVITAKICTLYMSHILQFSRFFQYFESAAMVSWAQKGSVVNIYCWWTLKKSCFFITFFRGS